MFFMALLYEGFKTLREFLIFVDVLQQKSKCSHCSPSSSSSQLDTKVPLDKEEEEATAGNQQPCSTKCKCGRWACI